MLIILIILILLLIALGLQSRAHRKDTSEEITELNKKIDALTNNAVSQQAYARLNADANKEMLMALTASTGNQVAIMHSQEEILRRQNER